MLRTHLSIALTATLALAGCSAEDSELDHNGENASESVDTTEDALVNAYGTIFNTGGGSLNVRKTPSTSGAIVTTVAEGKTVGIDCQTTGTTVEGTNIWDYLPAYGGYVTDAYVNTGYDSFIPGVPKCGTSSPPPPPPPSGLGAAIVTKGRSYYPYEAAAGDCNKFSTALGAPCEAWCGDFVRYVWGQAGANTAGLTGYSGTFRDYGIIHGTWKTATATPKVGDAVVWHDATMYAHVAIVSAVSGSTFRILHGNYDNDGDGRGEVFETPGYVDYTNTAGIPDGHIVGFASPVP